MRELSEEKNYSVQWMCKKLNVSRAAYYRWLNREIPQKELEDIELGRLVLEYHQKYRGILGYRRMTMFINRHYNKNYRYRRIRRIMRIAGVSSTIRRVRKCCTASNKTDQKAENILNRNFEAFAPNEKWTTDVCELRIPKSNRKLYLSAFLDLYDRSIVGWQLSKTNDNKLVFDTLNKAVEANPEAQPLFHSDRGYQYTSPAFRNRLKQLGIQQSMSRVGMCVDNCPAEGLWGIIKDEMYQMYDIYDEQSLIQALIDYMEFYNHHRYQERYDCKTPMEVRSEALQADIPKRYPIPVNRRIEKYKAGLASKNPTEYSAGLELF
ncbi:MAG TPA: IS3 family transposase [Erysipelotrichaceae bacterium]|nr:IS3 family transposase [Erysipelotrichaceae bacterium]HQB32861.1 IS3 family transposase [Erysipelotrichaceae bacterium]